MNEIWLRITAKGYALCVAGCALCGLAFFLLVGVAGITSGAAETEGRGFVLLLSLSAGFVAGVTLFASIIFFNKATRFGVCDNALRQWFCVSPGRVCGGGFGGNSKETNRDSIVKE